MSCPFPTKVTTMSETTLVYYTVYMIHTTLTLVRGEPSFDSLSKLQTQVHENAANVPCPSLANGDTGHLRLTMSDADFALNEDTYRSEERRVLIIE